MADDKQGRDKQAHDQERRQRERELEEARTRANEAEPMRRDAADQLGALDDALATHDYPATTDELVEAYGDNEIETQGGSKSFADALASTDTQTYVSAADARNRIQGLIHQ